MKTKEFTVSTDIYSEEKIIAAISDFEDVAEIRFSKENLLIQGESDNEIQEVFHEFMNYVLSI